MESREAWRNGRQRGTERHGEARRGTEGDGEARRGTERHGEARRQKRKAWKTRLFFLQFKADYVRVYYF